jgi:hypothetical protein
VKFRTRFVGVVLAHLLSAVHAEEKLELLTPSVPASAAADGRIFSQTWDHAQGKSVLRLWDSSGSPVDGLPKGKWHVVVRDVGTWNDSQQKSTSSEIESAVANKGLSGDWGKYTGLATDGDRASMQRGRYDDFARRSTMFQLRGSEFGSFINTASFSHCDEGDRKCHPGGGIQAAYRIEVTDRSLFPWADSSANSADGLVLQGYFKIPHFRADNEKSVAEISLTLKLHDTSAIPARALSVLVNLYRSKPTLNRRVTDPSCPEEYLKLHDLNNDGRPDQVYVSTRIKPGACFATASRTTVATGNATWTDEKLARVHITARNLGLIIQKANGLQDASGKRPYGSDLGKYKLTGVAVLQEVFPIGGDLESGYSVREFGAYRYTSK